MIPEQESMMARMFFGEDAIPCVYVFFRDGMFYPISLRDDDDAIANAECNPGTLRVEDANGRVV